MGNKWISRLVTFLFFGVPAVLFLLSVIYGTIPEALEHWSTAKDRTKQKELYSIIGDQDVTRIATKHFSGKAVCLDTFNDKKFESQAEQVWVLTNRSEDITPLDRDVVLMIDQKFDHLSNGFSVDRAPHYCRLINLEWDKTIAAGNNFTVNAECKRESRLEVLLRDTIEGKITVRAYNGGLPEDIVVEQKYTIPCTLEIEVVNNCLPRTYGSYIGPILGHEYHFGLFTEYNYCDNPENGEFKRQVLDKWERSKKLKEAIDEG